MYFKKAKDSWALLLGLSLLLAACRPGEQAAPTETPLAPELVYTSAAATANARMTANAAVTPTDLPATLTNTPAPPTETETLTPNPVAGTPSATPVGGAKDLIEFIADITVPDGATYNPGDSFTKTWRLKNIGNTTWTSAYALAFVSGTQMGAPATVPLERDVLAGQTVDVSVELTAPEQPGEYFGYFKLRNANGKDFGLGPNADVPFYVLINVSGETPSATATVTPQVTITGTVTTTAPTETATPQPDIVSDVKLNVDQAAVDGPCPHIFTFTAEFTLSSAATVTYQLEADTGFDITLPAPTTQDLDAGSHQVVYTLEFTTTFSGWARFHLTAPEDKASQRINLELKCQ